MLFRSGSAGGTLFMPSVDQVLADYSRDGGYVFGNAATDQGCDENTVLSNDVAQGFANGNKLVAFVAIDPANATLVRSAMQEFVGLMCCWEVPDAAINSVPQSTVAGWGSPVATWGVGTPNPSNGHCFALVDNVDGSTLRGDTWGMPINVPMDAIAALCADSAGGSLNAALDQDVLVAAIQKAPDGLDYRQLIIDIDSLGAVVPLPVQVSQAPLTLLQRIELALGRVL